MILSANCCLELLLTAGSPAWWYSRAAAAAAASCTIDGGGGVVVCVEIETGAPAAVVVAAVFSYVASIVLEITVGKKFEWRLPGSELTTC